MPSTRLKRRKSPSNRLGMTDTHPLDVGNTPAKRNGATRLAASLRLAPRLAAHCLIRAYQLTLSGLIGRQCRYLPSCSSYTDEAIVRHGLYAGTVMGVARLCRCHPWGNHGFDPVPESLPAGHSWARPWRYGDWRGPQHCEDISCEEISSQEENLLPNAAEATRRRRSSSRGSFGCTII